MTIITYIVDVHKILCGRNSVVECQLPKLDVVGSNPIARSNIDKGLAESLTQLAGRQTANCVNVC